MTDRIDEMKPDSRLVDIAQQMEDARQEVKALEMTNIADISVEKRVALDIRLGVARERFRAAQHWYMQALEKAIKNASPTPTGAASTEAVPDY